MSAAQPRAPRRSLSRRCLPLLAILALLVTGLFSPSAAQTEPLARSTDWAKADRPVARRHLASATAAAAAAKHDPRIQAPAVLRPRPSARVTHPAAPGREPFPGANAAGRNRTSGASVASGAPVASGASTTLLVAPDVQPTTMFDGLAEAESGNWVPPDPWVAANSAYVVQSVNSMVRISNRLGFEVSSIPVWSLFALTVDQNPTDPRILWDAPHGRWVAMAASFNGSDTNDFLNLAVSDTSDPTGSWNIYAIAFGDTFPDYPSIASSNDKIVVAADVFKDLGLGLSFIFSSIETFTWSSILGGGLPIAYACTSGTYLHVRAAQVLSSASDVRMILERTDDGEQFYFRLTGTGRCERDEFVDVTDLSFYAPFTAPPDPRQNGDTLVAAIDDRPTDAIWKNGKLWWVSTFPITYDAGATVNDSVVVWNVTAATGPAIQGLPLQISAGNGTDDFMGGIGLTRDNNMVVVYSESDAASTISMRALRVPPGGSIDTSQEIASSAANSPTERWGDFAGVAMDPVGMGAVWATHEVIAADGSWRTVVARLVVDGDVPTTPGTIGGALVTPATLGGAPAVRLSWPASTDTASGTVRYQIAQRIDGGPFGTISGVSGASTIRSLAINHTYQFQIRAVDAFGKAGAWKASPYFRPYLYQSTSSTTVTGSWGSTSSFNFSGSSTRYASTAGASATFTATTARGIAIVTTKAASRGSFKVYVDGVYKGTISTYSATTKFRQLVYQASWSVPGTHKLKIVVSGTSGHPRVDLDALVVLR